MESQLNAELYRSLNTPCPSETMATCSLKHRKGSRKPLKSLDQNYWTLGKVRRYSRYAYCGVSSEAPFGGKLVCGGWYTVGGVGVKRGAWGANKHSYPGCVVSCVVTLASLPVLGCVEGCHSGIGERQRTATKAAWKLPLRIAAAHSVSSGFTSGKELTR